MDTMTREPARAQDHLLVVCVLSFLLLIAGLSVGIVLGELRDELGLGGLVAAAHGSTFGLGLLVAAVFGLRLTSRVGRPRVFWGASVGVAAGIALLCLGHAWPVTLLGTTVSGLGCALLVMLMPGIIADGYGDRRAEKFAQVNAYPAVAGIAFSLAIGAVLSAGGSWRVPYLVITLALLLVMVAVGRGVVLPPAAPADTDLAGALRIPPVRRAWGGIVLVVVVEFSIATWAVTYVKEVGGASGGLAAAIGAVWGVCMFVGRLSIPRFMRSTGPWAMSVALLAAAAGIGWMFVGPGLAGRVAGLALTGLGCSVLYPLSVDRLYADGPDDAVVLGAVAALGSGTAIILGPPLVGLLADQVGLRAAVLPLAALALVGAWLRAPRSPERAPVAVGGVTPD
jgi:predicted MFS family arabinose efflux permease